MSNASNSGSPSATPVVHSKRFWKTVGATVLFVVYISVFLVPKLINQLGVYSVFKSEKVVSKLETLQQLEKAAEEARKNAADQLAALIRKYGAERVNLLAAGRDPQDPEIQTLSRKIAEAEAQRPLYTPRVQVGPTLKDDACGQLDSLQVFAAWIAWVVVILASLALIFVGIKKKSLLWTIAGLATIVLTLLFGGDVTREALADPHPNEKCVPPGMPSSVPPTTPTPVPPVPTTPATPTPGRLVLTVHNRIGRDVFIHCQDISGADDGLAGTRRIKPGWHQWVDFISPVPCEIKDSAGDVMPVVTVALDPATGTKTETGAPFTAIAPLTANLEVNVN